MCINWSDQPVDIIGATLATMNHQIIAYKIVIQLCLHSFFLQQLANICSLDMKFFKIELGLIVDSTCNAQP